MLEFTIYNEKTNETEICYGYNSKNMWERNPKYNPKEWTILDYDYID